MFILFETKHLKKSMKKLILIFILLPLTIFGQTFEITNGQSMCMIGKGAGQDATINPYADEEFYFALVENIGSVEFQIRIESNSSELKQFPVKSSGLVVLKLKKEDVLYFDSLTKEKAEVTIKYTLDEHELPPPPPPVDQS